MSDSGPRFADHLPGFEADSILFLAASAILAAPSGVLIAGRPRNVAAILALCSGEKDRPLCASPIFALASSECLRPVRDRDIRARTSGECFVPRRFVLPTINRAMRRRSHPYARLPVAFLRIRLAARTNPTLRGWSFTSN